MARKRTRLQALALIIAAATAIWAAVPGTAIRAEASRGTKSVLASPPGAPGIGGTADAAGPAGAPDPDGVEAEKDPSWTVTLVTGDVVRLTGKPGHQSAQVVEDLEPTGAKSISVIGKDKDVYVVPGAVAPMIAAGQLDMDLFDVSLLAREGYAEPTATTLPVLVTYKSDAEAIQAESERRLAGATVSRHLESVRGLAAQVDRKQTRQFFESISDPVATTEGTRGEAHAARPQTARPEVAKVWLDGKVHTTLDSSRTAIGADKAWAAGYAGTGVTVGVLDTGIDESHPDLAGQVVDKQSFVPGVPSVKDGYGHGTHVAGTIAGTGVGSGGEYAGVAAKARLAIGKVLDDSGSGQWSDVIAGMEWAAGKAKVVNMSLGGAVSDGTDPVSQALNDISRRTGALFVVSAGNRTNPQSIGTPGAADLALTVGAADHRNNGGRTASFSSKGPRLGDLAIKPEIAAPGVDIAAPRAAGTRMGDPVPGYNNLYRNASGTSMAAPHVAGAAAILLSQHSDWNAQQIRDALTSTATPPPNEVGKPTPVYWQGAGMVDVGRAVAQKVHATGILNLGLARFPQQPGTVVGGEIRYTNSGSQPVTLRPRATFMQAPEEFVGSETVWTPPAGAVSIPSEVTVPAGGSRIVKFSVDVTRAPFATVYGRIKAASADGVTVASTTIGFTREPETRELSLRAIDRAGEPITTTLWSYGWLLDLSNNLARLVAFDKGAGIVHRKGKDPRLPAGRRYAFQGYLGGFGAPPYYPLTSWTSVAEPEIVMDQDRTIVFDARKAGRIDVRTQRTATGFTAFTWMEREIPGKDGPVAYMATAPGGHGIKPWAREAYTLTGGKATTGTFRHLHSVRKEQPPIRLLVSQSDDRDDGAEFLPVYPGVLRQPDHAARQPRFPASAHLPLVDVGAGSADEVAAVNVAGKLALLRPPVDDGNAAGEWWSILDAAARRIADAGAAGIVVAPTADGVDAYYSKLAAVPSIPAAVLSYDEGIRLAGALARGEARVNVAGVWPSPYTYDLAFTQNQGLTNGAVHDVDDGELARVTARYHSAQDGYYYVAGEYIPAHTVRTEMLTPNVLYAWSRTPQIGSFVQRHSATEYQLKAYPAGTYEMNVGSGPWVPGQCQSSGATACLRAPKGELMASRGVFLTAAAGFSGPGSGNLRYMDDQGMYDRNETTIICEPPACEKVAGRYKVSDGVYKVVNDQAQRYIPLSVRSHTEWKVNVHVDQTPGASALRHQPAIQTAWYVDGGLDNSVPTGKAYTVRVVPSYGAHTQTHGELTARLWATYDDGQTWTQVTEEKEVEAGQAAKFSLRTPEQTNGFVGYRVVMTDRDGNAIDQTVIRAAFVKPGSTEN